MKFGFAFRHVFSVFAILWVQGCANPSTGTAPTNAQAGRPDVRVRWRNSLGMEFMPVPTTRVMFCVWKTRVQDFEKFVDETHYNATQRGWVLSPTGGPEEDTSFLGVLWIRPRSVDPKTPRGTWQNPGFKQGPTHPVCGVSWDDACAFCHWLTRRERDAGVLSQNQFYRLPTDAEWSAAVGDSKYAWGSGWPPPPGAGNFAGEEVLEGSWPTNRAIIRGYRDSFLRTSPVGSFAANEYGLYDLMGNLCEWCDDLFRKEMNSDERRKENPRVDLALSEVRVLRGTSWGGATPGALGSQNRGWGPPAARTEGIGFRVVLARDGPE